MYKKITKINILLVCFLTFLSMFIIGEANAASYYISPTGTDSGNCSLSSPCKTIKYASSKLAAGDTLYARGGTYYGQGSAWFDNVWKAPAGTESNPITFKAYPGETPIFDGQGTKLALLDFNSTTDRWVIVDGITIQNYKLVGIWIKYQAQNITIQNCTIKGIVDEHAIYLQGYLAGGGARNVVIRNNILKGHNKPNTIGIHANHGPTSVKGLKIYNNIFSGWGYSATLIGAGAEDIEIYNNTFYHNEWHIVFGYYGDGVDPNNPCIGVCNAVVKNNILSYTTNQYSGSALRVGTSWDINDVVTDYNLYYNVSGNPIYWNGSNLTLAQYQNNTANEDHSFVANPKFVNPESDWHLQSGSPAIDAGVTLPEVTNDADGNSRPSGVAYDIGAYEYVGAQVADTTPPASPTGLTVL